MRRGLCGGGAGIALPAVVSLVPGRFVGRERCPDAGDDIGHPGGQVGEPRRHRRAQPEDRHAALTRRRKERLGSVVAAMALIGRIGMGVALLGSGTIGGGWIGARSGIGGGDEQRHLMVLQQMLEILQIGGSR